MVKVIIINLEWREKKIYNDKAKIIKDEIHTCDHNHNLEEKKFFKYFNVCKSNLDLSFCSKYGYLNCNNLVFSGCTVSREACYLK